MESLFSQLNRELSAKAPTTGDQSEILGTAIPIWDGAATSLKASNRRLDSDFGEDIHAADLGRHPIIRAFFLDPDDRSLAANPALFTGGKLRRKDQDQFNVGSLLHF